MQLIRVFNDLEAKTNYSFVFDKDDEFLNEQFNFDRKKVTVEEVLIEISKEHNLKFKQVNDNITVSRILKSGEPKVEIALQEKTVTGMVTDGSNGEGLPGVNIIIKGTSQGTVTDLDGAFSIDVQGPDAVLVFSSVGFVQEEIRVGTQSLIDVALSPDVTALEEIVVIGYGTQQKKLVTGATTQVKNEELVENHTTRIESALQGLTPGMVIVKQSGQPGSDYNISIRGLSSINGNGPLVLIDGVPGNLNTLNPADVQSVDVLKDAASAAIYGSRAANGVILVTTKKGKAGDMQISYDAYYGVSNAAVKAPMLNAKEYAVIMNEAAANSGSRPYFFDQDYINSLGEGTDWQGEAYNKNAPTQSHYFGISGGGDVSTYSVSLSYLSEEGIFDLENKSKFERIGFRINSEHKLKKYLTIGENLTYGHRKTRGLGVTNIYNNFMRDILQASPLIKAYDNSAYDGFGRSEFNSDQINPIASMHYNYNQKKNYDDLIGDIYVELKLLEGLKFRSDFGGTLNYSYVTEATDTFTLTPSTYKSIPTYRQETERYFGYNFDNVLSYERDFGRHNLMALIGTNAQDNWFFNVKARVDGYLSNDAPVLSNVVPDTTIVKGDQGKSDSRLSYFGRISYNYDQKYMVNVSLRRDGSSRFGKNNRYGYFPAASVGWVITRENFLAPANNWLNFFKLRGSWGQNGKEPAEQYVYLARVGTDNRYYTFGPNRYVGVSPVISANPDLKWEASTQINVGFDADFFDNFNLTFDWYRKTSKDWIMQTTVPGVSGIAGISETENPFINGGNVTNTGVEVELGYTRNFNELFVDVRGNFAYNKNEVTDVPGGFINGAVSVLDNGTPTFYRVEEGFPIGYFWGYKTDGIFQTQEEIDNYVGPGDTPLQPGARPGDVKFVNLNGDNVINDDDKTMVGDPNPDFIYGLNLNVSYKGIDFGVNLQGQAGNQIVKAYRSISRYYNNYTTDVLDRWTGPGTSNTMPRVTLGDEANLNWRRFSDLYVQDAGYLKVKTINLGYDLKSSLLKNIDDIGQLRIYVSATNLFTFTKYDGLDPEVGYGSYYDSQGKLQDAYASGIDLGFYPTARTYMVGVNVKF